MHSKNTNICGMSRSNLEATLEELETKLEDLTL